MTPDNEKTRSTNPIDEFLKSDRENEIRRPDTAPSIGFDDELDDIAHHPEETSQEHSLNDLRHRLTPSLMETDILAEAVEETSAQQEEDK
jgi:hypothetical protein